MSLRDVVWGLLLAVVSAGCGESNTGSLGGTKVALAVPDGWSIVDVGWTVLSSDGYTVATGTQEMGAPQTMLSFDLVLPAGRGEVLELSVLTSGGVQCQGTSAPFNVIPGQSASVNIALVCETTLAAPGNCPMVLVQGPTPSAAMAPSGTVAVVAAASDPAGGGVLSFAWTATAGTLTDPAARSTVYTCSTAGAQTIVLTVTDEHPDSSCSATFLLPVSCLP